MLPDARGRAGYQYRSATNGVHRKLQQVKSHPWLQEEACFAQSI
jgi:hypothetical protein